MNVREDYSPQEGFQQQDELAWLEKMFQDRLETANDEVRHATMGQFVEPCKLSETVTAEQKETADINRRFPF